MRPLTLLKFVFNFIAIVLLANGASAAIPEKEILSAIGSKISQLETAGAWRDFVKAKPDTFPLVKQGESTVVVDKMTLELKGDTFTLGIGSRQMFLKAAFERVKKILNSPVYWKYLYGLDADANIGEPGDVFKARIFKTIPVVSDQDYTLEYRNFENGGVWFQRAKQDSDKNEFALRDNLKALEKVDGGTLYREYSIVYVLRWYLRALGPQMRSVMEKELAKINVSMRCMAESPKELSLELAQVCGKDAKVR
ncbi:MAG: hypothetical protein ABL958_12735 [Bdellovibrionia bacterium]